MQTDFHHNQLVRAGSSWTKPMVSGLLLADALADRFRRIVPAPYCVSSANGVLRVESPTVSWTAESHVAELLGDENALDDDANGRIVTASWNALSLVQDYISETLREPWPSASHQTVRRRSFFLPNVQIESDALRLWIGDATNVVLELEPIDLAELRTATVSPARKLT